jgi:hypothetical protein
MRELITAAVILATGFAAGEAMLNLFTNSHEELAPVTKFDWSQQALRDPSTDGCPGQYHQYAERFLISCWGHKGKNDAHVSADLERTKR